MGSSVWPGRSEEVRTGRRGQGLVGRDEEFGIFPSRIGSERWTDANGVFPADRPLCCLLTPRLTRRQVRGLPENCELPSQSRWKTGSRKGRLPSCNSVLTFLSWAGGQPHTEAEDPEVHQTQSPPSRSSVRLGPGKSCWLPLLSTLPCPPSLHGVKFLTAGCPLWPARTQRGPPDPSWVHQLPFHFLQPLNMAWNWEEILTLLYL